MSSIKEVAKAAGVSTTTVSYVLNNKGNISPETRQRVLEAVEELAYVPSIQAQNLRGSRSRIIGYAWALAPVLRQHNTILEEFLHYVMLRTENHGLHLLLFDAPIEAGLEVYEDLIKSRRVDGFILSHTQQNDQRLRYLHQVGFPFVSFGRTGTTLDAHIPWVDVDGFAGIREAASHLAKQQHRRIGIIRWPPQSVSGDSRYEGYLAALQDYNLNFDPQLVIESKNTVQDGYVAAQCFLQLADPPTALVTVSDAIALGAMQAYREAGQNIAITGFDDMPLCDFITPTLTSVRQPIDEAAMLLVDMLIKSLEDERYPAQQHLLQPELIIRESSLRNRLSV